MDAVMTEEMIEKMTEEVAEPITVDFVRQNGKPETKQFEVPAQEDIRVEAGILKEELLRQFDAGLRAEDEVEVAADENTGYDLMGYDDQGNAFVFPEDSEVDLSRIRNFQLSPKTTGGKGKAG